MKFILYFQKGVELMYYWIKMIATELAWLGSIMLEHVAVFPDLSTNNRPGSGAIDHAPHDVYMYND